MLHLIIRIRQYPPDFSIEKAPFSLTINKLSVGCILRLHEYLVPNYLYPMIIQPSIVFLPERWFFSPSFNYCQIQAVSTNLHFFQEDVRVSNIPYRHQACYGQTDQVLSSQWRWDYIFCKLMVRFGGLFWIPVHLFSHEYFIHDGAYFLFYHIKRCVNVWLSINGFKCGRSDLPTDQ